MWAFVVAVMISSSYWGDGTAALGLAIGLSGMALLVFGMVWDYRS